MSDDDNKITNIGAPTNSADAVDKRYIDSLVSGMDWQEASTTFPENPEIGWAFTKLRMPEPEIEDPAERLFDTLEKKRQEANEGVDWSSEVEGVYVFTESGWEQMSGPSSNSNPFGNNIVSMVRQLIPQTKASELVDVQPMDAEIGKVFSMNKKTDHSDL